MGTEYSNGTIDDHAHDSHGSDAYHAAGGHGHDNSYFKRPGDHVRAADKPEALFGHANQQEYHDAYRRELDALGRQLDKPVQDRTAAADRYAHGGRR